MAGLDPDGEALYERLVAGPGLAPDELHALASSLARLRDRGLLREVGGQFLPVDPDVAADIVLGPRERALGAARRHVDDLATRYRSSQADGESAAALAIYVGVHATEERMLQVRSVAQRELRCLVRTTERRECPIPDPDLPCRAVLDYEPPLIPPSVRARFQVDLPATLYLADDRLAVIPVRRADEAYALVVSPGGLLDALQELFEEVWSISDPMGSTSGIGSRASATDQLPKLLLAGLTDMAIAKQLGVSYRTAQRRIAKLMDDLGARTRFQAGVQAALRESELLDG
ncbi:hypothetical protein ACFQ4H_01605 [Micromonospora sonneratiae]|uniref:HTH luxR-type domain-containing protein n=1 Tax=Micromonospora sonneratiae TaxID=1184706 RepID=A0ABW3Y9G7_9ACTN